MAFSIFGNNREKPNEDQAPIKQHVVMIPITKIIPNRFQPRKVFDEQAITELAQTIAAHGLLQPIVLREYEPDHFEIIAGERRFRAITDLRWKEVPAIVEQLDDDETASMALIENLQREELTAVEEAKAYEQLMALNHLTQAQLAEGIGKSQGFVANKLRLLKLADPVKDAIMAHQITERHGRALLGLAADQQVTALKTVIADGLTVKQTERLVARLTQPTPKKKTSQTKGISGDTRIAVNTIRQSVKMVTDTGLPVTTTEEETADHYRIIIDIPKES